MQFLELKIPPVIQVAIVAFAMWLLSVAFPAMNSPGGTTTALAVSFVVIGLIIVALGVLEFRKADTTVDPRYPDKSSQLVESGIYRISRNPMYLGFLLMLFGWALYLMNYLAFLLLPLFMVYMNRFQIQPEEQYMLHKFGDKFDGYSARVRRWI